MTRSIAKRIEGTQDTTRGITLRGAEMSIHCNDKESQFIYKVQAMS